MNNHKVNFNAVCPKIVNYFDSTTLQKQLSLINSCEYVSSTNTPNSANSLVVRSRERTELFAIRN